MKFATTELSWFVFPICTVRYSVCKELMKIKETDPVIVASRCSKPPAQDVVSMKNIDLSEQGVLNIWEFGKQKLAERMRQGL